MASQCRAALFVKRLSRFEAGVKPVHRTGCQCAYAKPMPVYCPYILRLQKFTAREILRAKNAARSTLMEC